MTTTDAVAAEAAALLQREASAQVEKQRATVETYAFLNRRPCLPVQEYMREVKDNSLISWNDDCLSRLCGDWLTVVKVVVVADVFAGISVGAGVVVVVVGILFYSGSFIQAR
ncbi:unnamed protein product [Heligmosomoides polygyrus]|uniref:Uncharacterized protein n=1 Tax=Heligmosomoides polygyrus TaxID=6339 RepID=A0A183G0D0_HELPZ|nr:unnamed protein product [Heligmosomoides polygyrus]